jgi:ABC-type nitrate/sulfonate/bicarbonate transport system permease component
VQATSGSVAVLHAPAGPWARLVRALRDDHVNTPLVYALSILIALGGWQLAAERFHLQLLFPPPTMTFRRFLDLVLDGSLEQASAVSLARILAGFLIGSAAGIALGLLLGTWRMVRAIAEPYVHFFRFVPPLAWFAPVLLWFGTGELAKVLLIVYTTVFVVALNTMAGVTAIPRNKVRMARAFGARPAQIFYLITLPASLPYVFTGMRIAMGNSFMTVVAAEMLAATQGLGYLVNSGVLFLDTRTVFSGVIALGILGFGTDRLFQWLIRRFGGRFAPR